MPPGKFIKQVEVVGGRGARVLSRLGEEKEKKKKHSVALLKHFMTLPFEQARTKMSL
jgi:hypothetical protein